MATKKKAKRGAPVQDIWDDEMLAEGPAHNSPAVVVSERTARITRGYTKLSIWAFPLVFILLLVVYSNQGTTAVVDPPASVNQINSPGKDAALLAANSWISSIPAPIVGGQILSWNGYDVQDEVVVDAALESSVTAPDYTVEIHHFTFVDAHGMKYAGDVAVAVSEVNGAVALSTPSLNPIAPSASGWATKGSWYGLETATQSESVDAAIAAWTAAFTSGDPAALRLSVGDPDGAHSYVPLSNVADADSQVVIVAAVPTLNADGSVSKEDSKSLIIQIRMEVTWEAAEPTDSLEGSAASVQPRGDALITYDILVERADTASPVVVAWGGPGSGQHLKAYQNAVVDREISGGS